MNLFDDFSIKQEKGEQSNATLRVAKGGLSLDNQKTARTNNLPCLFTETLKPARFKLGESLPSVKRKGLHCQGCKSKELRKRLLAIPVVPYQWTKDGGRSGNCRTKEKRHESPVPVAIQSSVTSDHSARRNKCLGVCNKNQRDMFEWFTVTTEHVSTVLDSNQPQTPLVCHSDPPYYCFAIHSCNHLICKRVMLPLNYFYQKHFRTSHSKPYISPSDQYTRGAISMQWFSTRSLTYEAPAYDWIRGR